MSDPRLHHAANWLSRFTVNGVAAAFAGCKPKHIILKQNRGGTELLDCSNATHHIEARSVNLADGRDAKGQTKFVIGLGEASVAAALTSSATLSSAAAYGTSSAALGEGIQPSLIVQLPTLLAVLEGAGLSEDPTIAPLLPYLRSLNTVSGGGRSLPGGVERFRLVLALRG